MLAPHRPAKTGGGERTSRNTLLSRAIQRDLLDRQNRVGMIRGEDRGMLTLQDR